MQRVNLDSGKQVENAYKCTPAYLPNAIPQISNTQPAIVFLHISLYKYRTK